MFRVRVELDETGVWRDLEVPAQVTLDRLHEVLQIAMGWRNSHLHEFTRDQTPEGRPSERFAMELDLAEGSDGVPERDVRLDSVLAQPDDELRYVYDFGDSWEHTLTLVSVRLTDGDEPARCLAGERACPPEDAGGIGGYGEILDAVGRRGDPAVAELLTWADSWYPGGYDPDAFDVGATDAAVRAWSTLPPALMDLLRRIGPLQGELFDLAVRSQLDRPVLVDAEEAHRAVAPFLWLLQRAGADGLPLTSAGYLRPADVRAAAEAMNLQAEWVGAFNRESDTIPLLRLREVMQQVGLLRKAKGRLHATKAGRALADDPLGLWWYLARRLPVQGRDDMGAAGLLVLLVTASGTARSGILGEAMYGLRWIGSDGQLLSDGQVLDAAGPTGTVLQRVARADAPGKRRFEDVAPWASNAARTLARAALTVDGP
jgi:hypothetical protein